MDCLFFAKLIYSLKSIVSGTRECGWSNEEVLHLVGSTVFKSTILFLRMAGMKRLLSMLMYRSELNVAVCLSLPSKKLEPKIVFLPFAHYTVVFSTLKGTCTCSWG